MRKKILLLTLSLMLISSTVVSNAQKSTFVNKDVLGEIIEKAVEYGNKEDMITGIDFGLENAESIDTLKKMIKRKVDEDKKIKEYLDKKGIDNETIDESLDSLKSWSYDARRELVKCYENNEMDKAKELILNDGKIEEEKSEPAGGGGGGALPPKENPEEQKPGEEKEQPLTKLEPSKEIQAPEKIVYNFKDIENHWAKESIHKMVSAGIVSGVSEDEFAPNIQVTRNQMAVFIVKLLEIDTKVEKEMPFLDVRPDAWDYEFIKAAYNANLISGISAEQFAPNKQITREQMIVMIMNGLKYKNKDTQENKSFDLSQYEDANNISDWAKDSMKKAIELQIISGRTEKILDPQGVATRAEAITIIEKAYNIIHNQ